ncbi:MAG: hypothetical protein GX044_01055 [Firmicutes bacterium]|nr:hypothetical protein [Bacillota bacterium]
MPDWVLCAGAKSDESFKDEDVGIESAQIESTQTGEDESEVTEVKTSEFADAVEIFDTLSEDEINCSRLLKNIKRALILT